MKRFRWKLAAITFVVLLGINALLLVLDVWFPKNAAIITVARAVQAPGIPLIAFFPAPFGAGDDPAWDYLVVAGVSGVSSLVWSLIVGFFLRPSVMSD